MYEIAKDKMLLP